MFVSASGVDHDLRLGFKDKKFLALVLLLALKLKAYNLA